MPEQPRDVILRQLIAMAWVTKVNIDNVKTPLVVMQWHQDLEDAKQKCRFFNKIQSALFIM